MLDLATLNQSVSEALKNVPPAHNGATVSVSTQTGVQVYIAHKFDDHWSVVGEGSRSPAGQLDYGVAVHGSWTW
jgi:hypothetical protein